MSRNPISRKTHGRLVQTTVRLPKDLHQLLKEASLRRGEPAERIIQRGIEREINQDGIALTDAAIDLYGAVRRAMEGFRESHPDLPNLTPVAPISTRFTWSGWEAYRFLQSVPVMAVIKSKAAKIVWCNRTYEELCGRSLAQIRGKTLDAIGLVADEADRFKIKKDIDRVLAEKSPLEAVETVHIVGRPTLLLRVFRFLFSSGGKEYLGDLSFDFYRVGAGSEESAQPFRLKLPDEDQGALALCQSFLESCPSAVSVKDSSRRILWANDVFLDIVKAKTLEEAQGRRTEDLLKLPPYHEITLNDTRVVETGRWRFCPEIIPDRGERTSVRFPIFTDSGRVEKIGVLGAHFQRNVGYQGFPHDEP